MGERHLHPCAVHHHERDAQHRRGDGARVRRSDGLGRHADSLRCLAGYVRFGLISLVVFQVDAAGESEALTPPFFVGGSSNDTGVVFTVFMAYFTRACSLQARTLCLVSLFFFQGNLGPGIVTAVQTGTRTEGDVKCLCVLGQICVLALHLALRLGSR